VLSVVFDGYVDRDELECVASRLLKKEMWLGNFSIRGCVRGVI
jgi:hypothetical protein